MRAVKGASGGETGQDMNTRHNACVVAAILLAVATARAGDVIHVDDDNCPGPGSGSVRDPYCSIQTAIDNAVDTDEIVVTGGTYIENIEFLGKAITGTTLDGPDVTILDGGSPGPGDRPYTVTFQQGEGSDSRLEGFAVTNAFSVGSYGGIGCLESSPIISNCVIRDNIAEVGGGIGVTNGSPVIHGCLIIDNRAFGGVGVFVSGSSSDALIVNCTIAHNTTLDGGSNSAGGVMANGSAGVTIVTAWSGAITPTKDANSSSGSARPWTLPTPTSKAGSQTCT